MGALNRREQRVGLGLTVTRARKALLAERRVRGDDGAVVMEAGVMLDFAAGTYKRVTPPAGGAAGGDSPESMGSGDGRLEQQQETRVADAAAASAAVSMPGLWDAEGFAVLLRAALADPAAQWGALAAVVKVLLQEAAALLAEPVGLGLRIWGMVVG